MLALYHDINPASSFHQKQLISLYDYIVSTETGEEWLKHLLANYEVGKCRLRATPLIAERKNVTGYTLSLPSTYGFAANLFYLRL
jgi:hypothetical protein